MLKIELGKNKYENKTNKKKKKTSVLGEGCCREEADTYQRHDAQPVSLLHWAFGAWSAHCSAGRSWHVRRQDIG